MLGQGYAEMFPSRYRNMQVSVLYLEPVAGDELLFESIWGPSDETSPDRLLPSGKYSRGTRYSAELVVARRIVAGEFVVSEEGKSSQGSCIVNQSDPYGVVDHPPEQFQQP